jgi:hypothetical protein
VNSLLLLLNRLELPFWTPTGCVDWMSMRDEMGEEKWRHYISLNRQARALQRA